ncbi:ATP-binding protein [Streptomyces sp. G-G2]|uniref:ATP-binding protein n=1 Tax=Streptomyces sp. G-G2 TaxID=3046201 RepID=UPI0024BBD9DE|nr:ATP-binding protein [Streptomyces sp. G-G2]MDJ0382774.1 ATP-binding protein [Streptomyces sp. G-G2]
MRYGENSPLPTVPRTATQARDRVRSLIESAGVRPGEDALADALLVTSELATNAIRHGGGIAGFSASVSADGLRLAIADTTAAPPVARPTATSRPGGFGWPLIRHLTRSVAIRPTPRGGKCIEVRVPLSAVAS